MGDSLEGRNAVREALDAGVPLKEVVLADGIRHDRRVEGIVHAASARGIPVRTAPRAELDRRSDHGAHQGVMATVSPFPYLPFEELLGTTSGQASSLIVACDHVADPGNLGAIARSAEVVGAAGLLIPNRRAAQVTAVAYKSSAGALAHIPVAREPNLVSCLRRCKEEGFWVIGASERAADDIWHAPLEGRIVLVMGSEGEGLSRLVAETCDMLVSLPQVGRTSSLNVAQAMTAIAYEWLRRTRGTGGDA